MNNHVDMRPSLGEILNGYQRESYRPETAIAEFVDNSTANYFQNKKLLKYLDPSFKLKINIIYDSQKKELTIEDNAFGMDLQTFRDALKIAKRPEDTSGRNEYGMGLKKAASWFGKRWNIVTTKYDSNERYVADIDIEELMKTGQNEVTITTNTIEKEKHFTVIVIRNLNRTIKQTSFDKLKKDLSSIYRRDLKSGDIEITLNGEKLCYKEPLILTERIDGIPKVWKKEFDDIITFEGTDYRLKGFVALREIGDYKETGFALLRRSRVIVGGYNNNYKPEIIFGSPNSFMSLRLFGEVELDNWPVTQAKDDFDWKINGLEELFVEKLHEISKEYIAKAKTYRKNGNTGVIFGPTEVKNFGEAIVDDIKKINNTEVKIETETASVETQTIEDKEISSYTLGIRVLNDNYKVKVSFDSDETKELISVEDDGQIIDISINTNFPYFSEFESDKKFVRLFQKYLVLFILSEKICEKTSTNNGLIKHFAIRDTLCNILDEINNNSEEDVFVYED